MSKESFRLLEAMSALPDHLVDQFAPEEADRPEQKSGIRSGGRAPGGPRLGRRRRWVRWAGAAAACLCLAAGLWLYFLPGMGSSAGAGGAAGEEGAVFQSYAGPVLPLALSEETEAVTAERTLTWDFAPWEKVWISHAEAADRSGLTGSDRQELLEDLWETWPEGGRYESSTDVQVTDAYTLTNTTNEDQHLTLRYPFTASLRTLAEETPVLTAGEETLETTLAVGRSETYLSSWTDCEELLARGTVEETDLSALAVTVYRFTDPYGPEESDEAPNPSLQVRFSLDYDATVVLRFGFEGGSYDREAGEMCQSFSIPRPGEKSYRQERVLIVLGEDVEDLSVTGTVSGGADSAPLDGCGVTVERYESDLAAVLKELEGPLWEALSGSGDRELFFRCLAQTLKENLETPGWTWQQGAVNLTDLGSQMLTGDRVCYLEASVTVPAGGSLTLTASLTKAASHDYAGGGGETGLRGYDLVTTLGSNLRFTRQQAVLEDRGLVEIAEQNLGFDLAAGIRRVELSLDEPHYYLTVRARTEE